MAWCPWHGVCTLSFGFSAVTYSGPWPREIGRNATSRLFLFHVFFLVVLFFFFPPRKTKQSEKQVEPIRLGMRYFTGFPWDILFVLWCWEADKLKCCSREMELEERDELATC